jgi:hypothetical protein
MTLCVIKGTSMSRLSIFLVTFLFNSVGLGKWRIIPQTVHFPDLDNVPDDGPLVRLRLSISL